jgi:tetratricopeptide (TPR) repeat protein
MGWTIVNNVLKLVDPIHFDKKIVAILINRFRTYRRGNPDKVCDELMNVLETGIADSEVIIRLSKWCTWNSPKQEMMARRISCFLFGCYCKRLTDQGVNTKTKTWKKDYNDFIKKVANIDYDIVISKITSSMDRALTTENKIILAVDAEPGNYFCIECHNKVHWRNITERGPQFFHWRRNHECPLCSDGDGGWDEEYYKTYLGINYKERWIETIDELRCFGNLDWLRNKDWALNPLQFYLNEIITNRPNETDAKYDAETILSELLGKTVPETDYEISPIEKAKEMRKVGKIDKAIEIYDSIIKANPNSVYAFNGRGICFACKKNYSSAQNDFNSALSLNPEYGAVINNLGNIALDQNDINTAIEFYTQSLEYDPYSIIRLFNREKAYYLNGNYDNAIQDFLKVLDIPSIDLKREKEVKKELVKAYLKIGDEKNARKYN